MDKTKEAVRGFLNKAGHHDTTVHEQVKPAVVNETVKPTQHEEVNTAVEKEVHQDHYHHAVQPVQDREVLPEQHQHNVAAVQSREFDHRNHDETKRAVAQEAAKFKDQRVVADTTHTQTAAPTVTGEHVHHHIHETIQPVIHKETVQPKVVHTTVPVHETHHLGAKHHGTTELPPVSINEFKKEGGILGNNRTEHFHHIEGEPRNVNDALQAAHRGAGGHDHPVRDALHGDYDKSGNPLNHNTQGQRGAGSTAAQTAATAAATRSGTTGGAGYGSTTTAGPHSSNAANKADPRVDSDLDGSNKLGGNNYTTSSTTGTHSSTLGNNSAPRGAGAGYAGAGSATATGNTTGQQKQGGILDKLNPMTDSNGDGKAGFLK